MPLGRVLNSVMPLSEFCKFLSERNICSISFHKKISEEFLFHAIFYGTDVFCTPEA